MAYLFSWEEDASIRTQYRERGVPELLAGVPSNVVHVLLGRHPHRDKLVAHVQAVEARREIQKEHRFGRVMWALGRRQDVQRALDEAPHLLAEFALSSWKHFRLLPEERPVVARLLLAAEGNVETAFLYHDFLDTNEHAVLHNLFRRAAVRHLQELREKEKESSLLRGRDDRQTDDLVAA